LTKKCDATSGGTISSNTTTDCAASGAGSSTLTLAYDALDQLIQANRSGQPNLSFAYDDQGRRIRKTGTTTTHYLYNGSDIHAEYASPAGAPSAVYAHGPSMDDPIARLTGTTNSPDATAAYYHQDGLGSAIATTNAAGAISASQRFDAWGNRISGSGIVPQYGYTGREPDESGLEYYRARYYDPQVGRFTQRDPLGMVDGFNTYGYAAGNPVLFVDPEGTTILFADASNSTSAYSTRTDVSAGTSLFGRVVQNVGEFFKGYIDSTAAGGYTAPLKPELNIFESPQDLNGGLPYQSPFASPKTNEGQLARDLGPTAGILLALATRNPSGLRIGAAQDFFAGTRYTEKVLGQIKQGDLHAFPESVKAFQDFGQVSKITGGDGITRDMLKIPGEYRGKQGAFEFIKEADGSINHRLFKPSPGQ